MTQDEIHKILIAAIGASSYPKVFIDNYTYHIHEGRGYYDSLLEYARTFTFETNKTQLKDPILDFLKRKSDEVGHLKKIEEDKEKFRERLDSLQVQVSELTIDELKKKWWRDIIKVSIGVVATLLGILLNHILQEPQQDPLLPIEIKIATPPISPDTTYQIFRDTCLKKTKKR